jgi:invasion protein IalB
MEIMREHDTDFSLLPELRPGYVERRIDRPSRRQPFQMKFLLGFLVALVVVASGLGAAMYMGAVSTAQPQRTAQAEESAPVPRVAPGPAPAPAGGAAPAATAPGDATTPQPKVTKKETYGDWIYSCVELPDNGATPCAIAQQISNAQTKQTVFLWRINQDGKGGFVSIWQTPTDIFVGRGLTIDAGTPKPLVIPFQICTTRGCQAAANVEPGFLETLGKAEKATATLYLINGQPVTINVSVKGLPDALAQLQAQ